jgi:hypothetical protein
MPTNKTQRIIGSRRKVFNGTAEKTVGGLRKEDLIKNTAGRIVSLKRHTTMKQRSKMDSEKSNEFTSTASQNGSQF